MADVPPQLLLSQMNDPRVAEHLPLLRGAFDHAALERFLDGKAARWKGDGLGHWAIWHEGKFLGWGGFEKDGDVWDFGLVLVPEAFGHGGAIARQMVAFAQKDKRIDTIQFLLAPTRRSVKALERMGAVETEKARHDGQTFRRFLLNVS